MNECNDFGEKAASLVLSKMKHLQGSWSWLFYSATMKDLKIIICWKKRNKAEIDDYDTRFMFPLLSVYISICPNFMEKIFNT